MLRSKIGWLNIEDIVKFGSNVIWNENLDSDHKKIVYDEVEKRKNQHPELNKLWIDVYYKIHGLEPTAKKWTLVKSCAFRSFSRYR